MEGQLSGSQFAERLAWALNAKFEEGPSGEIRFNSPQIGLTLDSSKLILQNQLDQLLSYSVTDGTSLVSSQSYEILVQEVSPFHFRRFRDDKLLVAEPDDELEYELSPASDEYLTWLVSTLDSARAARDIGFGGFLSPFRIERARADIQMADPLDALRKIAGHRFLTLKVRSKNRLPPNRFQLLASAFLFQIAFNLDVAFVPVRSLDELSSRGRIWRMRRSRTADMDPPRRTYDENLVAHYILAVSSDSPTVRFLSYYHVAEHFFETIFNDELVENIQSQLTYPAFSYKRKKDISKLVETIKKSLQIRSDIITFSEFEALRLTIARHVDINLLTNNIDEYSSGLVEYYKSNEVPFAKGVTVDLTSGDRDGTITKLSRRIYATRNSLAHSKDGDKQRYVPFKDEQYLLPEIPLMRFISEQVILSTSGDT